MKTIEIDNWLQELLEETALVLARNKLTESETDLQPEETPVFYLRNFSFRYRKKHDDDYYVVDVSLAEVLRYLAS